MYTHWNVTFQSNLLFFIRKLYLWTLEIMKKINSCILSYIYTMATKHLHKSYCGKYAMCKWSKLTWKKWNNKCYSYWCFGKFGSSFSAPFSTPINSHRFYTTNTTSSIKRSVNCSPLLLSWLNQTNDIKINIFTYFHQQINKEQVMKQKPNKQTLIFTVA